MKNVLDKIKIYYQRYGLRRLGLKIFSTIFTPVFAYYETLTFEKELNNNCVEVTPKIKISFSFLASSDLPEIRKLIKIKDYHFLEQVVRSADKCLVAKHNNQICFYIWVTFGEKDIRWKKKTTYKQKSSLYP